MMMKLSKPYLGAALTVGLSTASGPFLMTYSISEREVPYFLATGYFLIVSSVGCIDLFDKIKQKSSLNEINENPKTHCNGHRRIHLEHLLDKDELKDIRTNNL